MRSRPIIWLLLCLLLLAGGLCFWQIRKPNPAAVAASRSSAALLAQPQKPGGALPGRRSESIVAAATAPSFLTGQPASAPAPKTNRFAYRLSNTPKTVGQLVHDDHALLLENALIDTRSPLNFSIPQHLRAAAEPGSYLVQARGPVDDAFRAALTAAGGTIISYIPNNAYLVRLSAAGAGQLSGGGLTQAVTPYEPIYKLKPDLLPIAMESKPLPPDATLKVIIFADGRERMLAALQQAGAKVLGETRSWFGLELTLRPGENWTALAQLPEMMVMELAHPRVAANDLSRVRIAVASDSVVTNNYLNLTGAGVLVSVNDTGVDPLHPDLTGRVLGDFASSLVDNNGHGTFVAGIIAGSGAVSATVSNVSGSINPGVLGQYRGKAPGATNFSQSLSLGSGSVSDVTLQETAALTNAFISNNSWHYGNDNTYGIGAASYDAAVRDALPGRTGSQPLLVVFAAGNSGAGNDSGLSGDSGSILSPGTAKNVITVGALELARSITNSVEINCTTTNINGTNVTVCVTNYPWQGMTSSGNQVASFSSRGNVGIGVEGDFGRFKPDLVAPGTFVVSTRSTTWDEKAYYNPTNHHATTYKNQVVQTNGLSDYALYLPANAVGFSIRLYPNQDSPLPFPNLPIFVRRADLPNPPAMVDFSTSNNVVSVPPDSDLAGGGVGTSVRQNWFYTVGNATTQNVSFTLVEEIITTNDLGNYYAVLSNLNNSISGTNPSAPHHYRYESGTSMAAADVSGTLALMQQFFEQGLHVTNSPALMKALLINGARSAGSLYDFEVQNDINYQGWGLLKLNNSLPPGITNAFRHTGDASMQLFDQSPTNALATGQSQTRLLAINDAGRNVPLRVTLVWTDPPGNPVAGVKLVNDLDLIVTNLTTGEVFFGNDIQVSSNFTFPWATNSPPIIDSINNVENVYLAPSLGTNYSITVVGRRVNVNAVTAQANNVVQDFALVIASGNGEVTNALMLTEQPVMAVNVTNLTPVTNSFAGNPTIAGSILLGQHVGANTPLLGTTNGMTNQWHFYIVTNTTAFTNAAFITFLPPELSLPRIAVRQDDAEYGAVLDADIDLYVSTNPNLLTLDPAVLAAADQSRNRGGTEFVAYSNAPSGAVYYVGVKSEDQMAAEYVFFGGFSLEPFSQKDENGNVIVNGFPIPTAIPDGTPAKPGGALTLGLALQPVTIRRLIVTNSIYHENLGDLVSTLSHARKFAVLNNHRSAAPGTNTSVYEDNDEQSLQHPDGPGKLRDFVGDSGLGVWLLTTVDNALSQTGSVTGLKLRIEPSVNSTNGSIFTIEPGRFVYEVVDVPVGATNLEVCIENLSLTPEPVELYLRRDGFPTRTTYDHFKVMNPTNDCLTITQSDLPPLQPGRYYIGVFNSSGTAQTIRLTIVVRGPGVVVPIIGNSIGNQPLRDDAVANSIITVTNVARVQQVEVGLRIDHPRVSDLAVTLISPRGTRVLLAQNRGGTSTAGFGSSISVSNFIPVAANGGPAGQTTFIDTGTTVGSVTIDYNFYTLPDQMTVYYQGVLRAGTGMTNGSGRFTLTYGPGASTFIEIRMNEFGNNNTNPPTAWDYTASSINNSHSYLTFTENTNLTTTPIKFAVPPLTPLPTGPPVNISDFEPPQAAGDFVTPAIVDGWNVLSNQVTVVNDPANAQAGNQFLALASGSISRALPTVAGRNYVLRYWYRGPGIVSWWRGDNSTPTRDEADGNNGVWAGFGTLNSYIPGVVGQAFSFDGTHRDRVDVGNPANLQLEDFTIEAWIKRSDSTFSSIDVLGVDGSVSGATGVIFGYGRGGYLFGLNFDGRLVVSRTDLDGVTSTPLVTDTGWHHVAVTKSGLNVVFYRDGVPEIAPSYVHPVPYTFDDATCACSLSASIGSRGDARGGTFFGAIDEPSVYQRALSASEVRAIFSAGSSGKFDPAVVAPQNLAKAQVSLGGETNVIFGNNTIWQSKGFVFTATTNGTALQLTGIEPGMLLDSFTLTEASGPRYVLPEESLEVLKGENAQGNWTLELWDSRTGATNNVSLVSWELQFIFQDATPLPGILLPGVAGTNTVPPGGIAYYIVDVPAWAQFATNTLIFATGPLNVLFNQTAPPAIGAVNPGDFPLFGPVATPSSYTLSTAGTPPLLPGQRYYLGVHNPSPSNSVTFALRVDFDITPLTNGVPVTSTLAAGALPRYFYYDVTTNAVAVSYQLFGLNGNVNLVARRGAPLPTLASYDYGSFSPGSNPEDIVVFTNSAPVALAPGRWYLGVFNADVAPVTYTILATEYGSLPGIITLTNGIPYFNTNSAAGSATDYYRYVVTPAAARVQFEINGPTADVTLVARKGLPLPDLATFDYLSANTGTNDELIVVFPSSAPVALTAGDWFLSAVNISGGPASYAIKATEWPVTGQPIVITNSFVSSNSFCLTWTSLPGVHYFVQGLTNLSSTNWVTIPPPVTAVDYFTTWCVSLPSPFSFFRVVEGLDVTNAPIVPPLIITLTNGISYSNTNTPAATDRDYYRYVVTTNAARAQFEINGASANFTLVARKGLPLPGLVTFDYLSANAGTNDELIVVITNSTPVALTPGDWYLAAVNLSGAPATYSIRATEWAVTGEPIVVTGTQVTSTNFCLTWNSLIGAHYYIQGLTNLSSTNWVTVSPPLTAVTTSTTWCIALPSPFQFFRVRDGLAPSFVAAPPLNTTVTRGTNGFFTITWTGGRGARYQVRWTPTLAPPVWNSFTNLITSTNTQFWFLDNGTQFPLGPVRFYQPYQIP